MTYNFKSLPAKASIVSATLYTAVYCGHMIDDKHVNMVVNFNGKHVATESLSSTYSYHKGGSGAVTVNDHCNRVTSDYFLWYDVTSLAKQSNTVNICTDSSYDGKIKLITLIIAYNDGSSNKIAYWINQGHDVADISDYKGNTSFNGLPTGYKVQNAALNVVHLSSVDGGYTFNGVTYVGAGAKPQGSYSGSDTWDVTNQYKNGADNTLTYQRVGDYYKIVLATMTVKYAEPAAKLPDLQVTGVTCNSNAGKLAGKLFSDRSNVIKATIKNKGSSDAGPFKVLLKIGKYSKVVNVKGLASGAITIVSFTGPHITAKGISSLYITADSGKQVKEVDETNNMLGKSVKVIKAALPDLTIANMVVPTNLKLNKAHKIAVTIKNEGYSKSNAAKVTFYVNGVKVKTSTINKLPVKRSTTLKFTWKPTSYGKYKLTVKIDPSNLIKELDKTNNVKTSVQILNNPKIATVFMISDDPGANILNTAANGVINSFPKVSIQIRSCSQVQGMSNSELSSYIKSSKIFIADKLSTSVSAKISKILSSNPEIANKQIFLILEPDTGYVNLMKYSSIGGSKVLHNFTTQQLSNYLNNTERGNDYNNISDYLKTAAFPEQFNRAVLYKDLSDSASSKDEILWALSYIGFKTTYQNPPSYLKNPIYGIYRGKWYSYLDNTGTWHSGLEEYKKNHFKAGHPCVGVIESTTYVKSNQLQPYNAIIKELESKGINVIPIVAYGATSDQLNVMVESFTNATNFAEFVNDSSKYKINVDAIVDMVAFGLGGDDFKNVTSFFTAINVPVIAAVHSDYETNAQYELGTTGLGVISGDKWWHIAILEAQGIVDPMFVGGKGGIIDPKTGADISGYVPYNENIKLLANKINGWTQLKYMSNSSKKIAMIYYNYPPGKQNIAASYLDPVESIVNLLNILKSKGYDVKNMPSNSTILLYEMLAQGTNIANWAPGSVKKLANNNASLLNEIKAYQATNTDKLDLTKLSSSELKKMADTPGVILYPVSSFMKWFNHLDDLAKLDVKEGPVAYIGALCKRSVKLKYTKDMDDKIDSWYNQINSLIPANKKSKAVPILKKIVSTLKSYVNSRNPAYYKKFLTYKKQFLALKIDGMSGWGKAPGNIMTVTKKGVKYFVLPGIQFGNVLIAPEPQRGWEGNANQLYHNSVVPPHYQYLAFYAYLQQKGYDSMVFMGRHATHEWLPGKEVLPAAVDFTSIVTGSTPQIYFYIVDGLSEGMTAKRRGSAVIIDHLTPPMGFTQLYGGLSDLESLVEDYDGADASGKQTIINKIKQVIKDNHLEGDIGVNISKLSGDKLINTVNSYLNSVANTFYPCGLDVIGQKWTDDQIALLVTSMLSVPFEIPGGGTETTSLQKEIALIMKGKPYADLSASDQNKVQNKCVEVVKQLIHSDVATVASNLTSNPSSNLLLALNKTVRYVDEINESTTDEVSSFLNALNGGYIPPGLGNDPINDPDALPTGKNFYQDQAAEIPTHDAYNYGKTLTLTTLKTMNDKVKKIVVGLWDVETARDNGALVSMILSLLGTEPQWTASPSAGSGGAKLQEMPIYDSLSDLIRPSGGAKKRIDVVVVIDGNFRDLYSRQVGLIDKAFKIALARSYNTIIANSTLQAKYGGKVKNALDSIMTDIGFYGVGNEPLNDNYVAYDWVNDFQHYMDEGMNYTDAGNLAIARIFAPPENDYGADVSQAVRMIWTVKGNNQLADNYLNRMGHIYSDTNWGTYSSDSFKRALSGASTVVTTRNTNLYGILDNDDFFDYWGGLSMAMKRVNGKTPDMYVLNYANRANPEAETIEQFMNRELNTRYYNPQWIKGMMGNGYTGAGYMQKFASNLWGWQVTRPGSVKNWMWDKIVDVYLKDSGKTGVTKFLENGNNAYAMISMTGTLLTAAYKGYWKTDKATLKLVANKWAKNVIEHGVACCDCSCGNIAMMKWAMQYVNPDMLAQFQSQLYRATQNSAFSQQKGQQNSGSQSSKQSGSAGSGKSSAESSVGANQNSKTSAGEQSAGTGGQSGDQGQKAYDVSQANPSGSSQSGMPIAATLGVILLVCLVAVGYFKGKFNDR